MSTLFAMTQDIYMLKHTYSVNSNSTCHLKNIWGREFPSENGQGKSVSLTDLERVIDLEESILGYSLNKRLETAATRTGNGE